VLTNDANMPGGPAVSDDSPFGGISKGPFSNEGPSGGWGEVPPGVEHVDEALAVVLEQSLAITSDTVSPGQGAAEVWIRCTDHRDIPEVLHFIGCVSEMDDGDEDALRYYENLIREMAEDVVAGRSESFAPGGRKALLDHLASIPEPTEPRPYVPDWDELDPKRWLSAFAEDRELLRDVLQRFKPSVPLIVLQGSQMRTSESFRRQVADVLGCPEGAATDNSMLKTALADLDWLQPRGLILAIEQASQVLADESDETLDEFVQMLVRLRCSWRDRDDPAPWTIVLADTMYALSGMSTRSATFNEHILFVG
jgi:hypothetical protein